MSNPHVISRQEHTVSRKDIREEALRVLYRLNSAGHIAYLAGGGVRDLLLHRKPKDFDIVTDAHPHQVRALFKNCRLIGRRFRLAHVFFHDHIVEVATFRASEGHQETEDTQTIPQNARAVKTKEGIIVRDNVFGTPREDALRRDFTVNALFYNIADFSILDYINGTDDLKRGLIRSIGDPKVRFMEDPVRMIRAIRFASTIHFQIEEQAFAALHELASHLSLASPSRLYEEVLKMFFCGHSEKVFHYLYQTGLFRALFPEFNAWLSSHEGQPSLERTQHAFCKIDHWIQQGKSVTPALLFSLIFGAYHESLAAPAIAQGQHPGDALKTAAMEHLSRITGQVMIPRHVALRVGEIMATQPRLHEQRTRDIHRLPQRPFFAEAVVYLDCATVNDAKARELAADWVKLARAG